MGVKDVKGVSGGSEEQRVNEKREESEWLKRLKRASG
jgi:hypothetical protein